MAFTTSDFNLFVNDEDTADLSTYTIVSKTYTQDNLYLLFVGSTDISTQTVPTGITTTGLTWNLYDQFIDENGDNSNEAISFWWGIPTANTTDTTDIDFSSAQSRCTWQIIEVTTPAEVVQSANNGAGADAITITLNEEVGADSLGVSGFYGYAERTWVAGAGHVELSTGTHYAFSQYNLGQQGTISASIVGTLNKVGIAVEIGETGVTPDTVTTIHTLYLTDDGTATGNPVICESALGFEAGVTAELWPAGVEANKEIASVVTALDNEPTATPRFEVTFTVAPSSGAGDIVNIIYDATVGDIKSVTGGIALASDTFSDVTMTC